MISVYIRALSLRKVRLRTLLFREKYFVCMLHDQFVIIRYLNFSVISVNNLFPSKPSQTPHAHFIAYPKPYKQLIGSTSRFYWSKLVQTGPKMSKIVQNCPKWSKLVNILPNWSEIEQTGPIWSETIQP